MRLTSQSRFHKLYEKILLSRFVSMLLGFILCVVLPFYIHYGFKNYYYIDQGQFNALIISSIAFVLTHIWCNYLTNSYPGGRSAALLAPQILTVYGFCILATFLLYFPVSRLILVTSGLTTLFWLHIEYILTFRMRKPKLAVVNQAKTQELIALNKKGHDIRVLETPNLNNVRYDAVVADFKSITPEWERFLTQCALNRIPVLNSEQVFESLTGRVRIRHMTENNIGSLLPSLLFEFIKTCFDWVVVLLTLPITLPLVLVTALLVKLESSGPAFFCQTRVGLGNKPFRMYKIRSMRHDIEAEHNEAFAEEDDPRVTRIGKIIRKLRIDELPQLLNILKGEMSLIGPRPEQPSFVEEYDKKIPFYSYRHVVKPGITGWAQVRYGYTSDAEEAQIKIEHDFFYIKHCSISLDFYITLLTIKTMITGFGAR